MSYYDITFPPIKRYANLYPNSITANEFRTTDLYCENLHFIDSGTGGIPLNTYSQESVTLGATGYSGTGPSTINITLTRLGNIIQATIPDITCNLVNGQALLLIDPIPSQYIPDVTSTLTIPIISTSRIGYLTVYGNDSILSGLIAWVSYTTNSTVSFLETTVSYAVK